MYTLYESHNEKKAVGILQERKKKQIKNNNKTIIQYAPQNLTSFHN